MASPTLDIFPEYHLILDSMIPGGWPLKRIDFRVANSKISTESVLGTTEPERKKMVAKQLLAPFFGTSLCQTMRLPLNFCPKFTGASKYSQAELIQGNNRRVREVSPSEYRRYLLRRLLWKGQYSIQHLSIAWSRYDV